MIHRFPVKVRFYELDPYGHVNHSVYVQYFEAARVDLLQEAGLSLEEMQRQGVRIVVTGIETHFRRSAGTDAELTVETGITEFKRVTSRWRQRILCCDEVYVEQDLEAAATNPAGRPIRFPERYAAALRPYRWSS